MLSFPRSLNLFLHPLISGERQPLRRLCCVRAHRSSCRLSAEAIVCPLTFNVLKYKPNLLLLWLDAEFLVKLADANTLALTVVSHSRLRWSTESSFVPGPA